jgi:hypothetical protein
MKVRLPKSWHRLPQSEKEKIAEVKEQEINQYYAKLQKNWLMLSCIVLHNNFGFGKKRCLLYLANWREVYRLNAKLGSDEAQQAWLRGEMDRIFGKGNYPYEYIDKLEEM